MNQISALKFGLLEPDRPVAIECIREVSRDMLNQSYGSHRCTAAVAIRRAWPFTMTTVFLALLLALAACGGSESDPGNASGGSSPPPTAVGSAEEEELTRLEDAEANDPSSGRDRRWETAMNSAPLALSADNKLLWVVNPDDDSVSVLRTDSHVPVAKIKVGNEPQGVALDPANRYAYVANAASSTVSVIRIRNSDPQSFQAEEQAQLTTGAEPWNVVASPDGRRIFVANSSQDTISVISAYSRRIIGHIDLRDSACNDPDRRRHFQPRGLAVSADSTRLYVSRFLSFTSATGIQADDLGKVGLVCQIKINTRSVRASEYAAVKGITLAPQVTGFKVDKPGPDNTAGDGVADDTFAFPNQMQSIVIRGDQAYLPNIAASPSSPQVFNTSTMAYVNVLDGINSDSPVDASAGKFLNLHLGAREPETGKPRLFFANIWGIGFTNQSGEGNGYVVSAGSDLLVKVNVDAAGKLTFTGDDNTTRYIDLNDPDDPATSGANAGKNPLGIVVDRAGRYAYTMNFVSRNVSVVDLAQDKVVGVIKTTDLPLPGTKEEEVQVGAEMFFSSRGLFDPTPDGSSRRDRLSSEGWQNCASCHFDGLTDGVVWSFGNGPRKSLSMNGTFNPRDRNHQKILNNSPVRDEVEDFDLNIRNTSGPGPKAGQLDPDHGLIIPEASALADIADFVVKSNANRNQVSVTLPGSNVAVPAWNGLREWLRLAIRTPNAPLDSTKLSKGVSKEKIDAGRELFYAQGCQGCHGGDQWTSSRKDFDSPPSTTEIATETASANPPPAGSPAPPAGVTPVGAQFLFRFVRDVGSFNLGVAGAGNPIDRNIGGIELANSVVNAQGVAQRQLLALGADHNADGRGKGYNVPMKLGIHNSPPYMHNGACETLLCVVSDKNHRTGNGVGPDVIGDDPYKLEALTAFVESIDDTTEPFK